jgi:ParB-like chromosome segregation protein Spo0J
VNKIKIEYLAPDELMPNPWNSNRVGPEMEARLEASLKEFGFVKPVVCRRLEDDSLQIVGGEHRVRKAQQMGLESIPVVILDNISDVRAKALGLADNGRYGEDDALKLAAILADIDSELMNALPFDEQDLAGIFSSAAVDLDDLGFDETEDTADLPALDAPRAAITHELMRFKVPIEDRSRIEDLIKHVIKTRGFSSEQDSMVAAGMALVVIANAAGSSL